MTPSKINVRLLERTLAYIEKHPEEWDQTSYRCGTACCFAGHVALLAGGKWRYPKFDDEDELKANRKHHWPTERAYHRARRVLGVTEDQGDKLFSADNKLSDLKRIVKRLIRKAQKKPTSRRTRASL